MMQESVPIMQSHGMFQVLVDEHLLVFLLTFGAYWVALGVLLGSLKPPIFLCLFPRGETILDTDKPLCFLPRTNFRVLTRGSTFWVVLWGVCGARGLYSGLEWPQP